jgi:energy-coupling factor transporter ATP-binding protein EcfA2
VSTLDQLGLAAVIDSPVETLAYGEQRLVEVALALAMRPRLLLLDGAVRRSLRGEARRLLGALTALPASLTVLMIEHDMDMVFAFADRVAVLAEGRLIRVGTPPRSLPIQKSAIFILEASSMPQAALELEGLSAATARSECWTRSAWRSRAARVSRCLDATARQDHACPGRDGPCDPIRPAGSGWREPTSPE